MLAVVSKGETVAGVIYDPIGNDWALCEKGSGAWLYRTDGTQEQMQVRPSGPLEQMIGIANTGFFDIEMRRKILSNLAEVRLFTSYRCAAHEYRLLGQGHMDFAMYNKLMPWDHLGGALMMQEAGAHVARFDGSAYLPHHTSGGLLVASDIDAWQELRERIFTVD
jgi:fructose-1,6-bisphosphatase/inositol monophosphatase family enzyme